MNTIFLSRRNLLTLINKLDRVQAGGESACAIIKYDSAHPEYPTDCAPVIVAALEDDTPVTVTAVEDDAYYTDREAGAILPIDDPDQPKH